jgi:hypothetical protein
LDQFILLNSAKNIISNFKRLNFVAAREGFLIKPLAMVNVKRQTPEPSIIFTVNKMFLILV